MKLGNITILLFGLLLMLIVSCNDEPRIEFLLAGKTNGINDGDFLYLNYDNEIVDSTIVENNEFIFNSLFSDFPVPVFISTKDFSQYRFMWLENKQINFDASTSNFREAKIVGSKLNDLAYNLAQRTANLSREDAKKVEIEFVKNHPNSIMSSYMLSVYSTTWGRNETKKLYDKFTEVNRNSKYGKEVAQFLKLSREPEIGDQFVDFGMEDINGDLMNLSSCSGKIILLEFWASWCGPCRDENPNLLKTYQRFHSKGFDIFAVSLDNSKNDWIEAIKQDKLSWKHVSDLSKNNKASLIYGVSGIPDNFLISKDGEIIGRNLRGEELNKKLSELIQ